MSQKRTGWFNRVWSLVLPIVEGGYYSWHHQVPDRGNTAVFGDEIPWTEVVDSYLYKWEAGINQQMQTTSLAELITCMTLLIISVCSHGAWAALHGC